jgi:hypothetical protein
MSRQHDCDPHAASLPGYPARQPPAPTGWAASRTAMAVLRGHRVRWLKVLRFPWDLLTRVLVRAGRFDAAGQVLARAAMVGVGVPLVRHRTVLLGGVSRVGKSTLAATLASLHGFRHIDLDYLVNRIYSVDDPTGRARLRASFYRWLLRQAPVGHIIEGDDLVITDRWHASGNFGREPLDLGMLGELAKSFALPAFVMGNTETTVEDRLTSLKRDDSWVRVLSEPEMHAYAKLLVSSSVLLRDGCEAAGVTYLEAGGADFEAAIGPLAARILDSARSDPQVDVPYKPEP